MMMMMMMMMMTWSSVLWYPEHDGCQGNGGAGAGVGGERGGEDKVPGGENSAPSDRQHVSGRPAGDADYAHSGEIHLYSNVLRSFVLYQMLLSKEIPTTFQNHVIND